METQEIAALDRIKLSLNSVDGIKRSLEAVESEIIKNPNITPDQEVKIRRYLQDISGREKFYKQGLENLERTFKQLGAIDIDRLKKLEREISFGSEDSKKFKTAQIDIERNKIKYEDKIIKFKKNLESLINNLNLKITSSLKTIRTNPQDSLNFLSASKMTLRDILKQDKEMKRIESEITKLHKAQRQLLKEESQHIF